MLTVSEVATSLPKHLKSAATQELTDKLNNMSSDPEIAENIRNNFQGYVKVLNEGKFKTDDYLNAVAFVTHKLMGHTNQRAWCMTFPKKHQRLVAEGRSDKEISSYVAGYKKGRLVNLILEQTLIPVWVMNQDILQKAINAQSEIMLNDDNSAKVRSDAADSLMNHLKRPETKQVDLNIDIAENSAVTELNDMLSSLAKRSQELIGQGVSTKEIAHQDLGKPLDPQIIDVTPIDVTAGKEDKPFKSMFDK
jgi:flagellar motor switch protein FliG